MSGGVGLVGSEGSFGLGGGGRGSDNGGVGVVVGTVW